MIPILIKQSRSRDTFHLLISFYEIKNSLRSGRGKNSYGKTNNYTWFKLSCNQPFIPRFEFLFEYHYDVTFHVGTLLHPLLIQRLERKFLKSFLQLLELKCMAVEEKQLYLRGGLRQKIEPCLNMLERLPSSTLPSTLTKFTVLLWHSKTSVICIL